MRKLCFKIFIRINVIQTRYKIISTSHYSFLNTINNYSTTYPILKFINHSCNTKINSSFKLITEYYF